jgi:hypothetical protein
MLKNKLALLAEPQSVSFHVHSSVTNGTDFRRVDMTGIPVG